MLFARQSFRIGQLFKVMGDPFRVRLLLALTDREACVCHLERSLGKRQAYISQHLMVLRKAGLLTAKRKGKFVFYAIKEPGMLDLIHTAAALAGAEVAAESRPSVTVNCTCPQCVNEKELEC